ncbi:hypothetical protein BVX99_00425 [bacterium F16]|nr:hypothetical protein BVX99_00425 [bacterium F16]
MRAIYAFSGDPITYGHIDIVKRAARTYSDVVVAIGENPDKSGRYLFSAKERLRMAEYALKDIPNVTCHIMTGLLAEYAYRHGFDVIIRGVRNTSDLEGELTFFAVNQSLHPAVDTVFLPTQPKFSHISSSVVKAIVAEGGDASSYCPLPIKEMMERRMGHKMFIGVAGGIAAGKSCFANDLVDELKKHAAASYISLDNIGHFILSSSDKALYLKTRQMICREFGNDLMNEDTSINRKALGRVVFNNAGALKTLNVIMRGPMLARLYEETHATPSGIIVLEGAILVEANWGKVVNNNVILVDAPEESRIKRLVERDNISPQEAQEKINRQVGAEERKAMLEKNIKRSGWGRYWEFMNTSETIDCSQIMTDILTKWNSGVMESL